MAESTRTPVEYECSIASTNKRVGQKGKEMKRTIKGMVRLTIIRTLTFEVDVEDTVGPDDVRRAVMSAVEYDTADVDVLNNVDILSFMEVDDDVFDDCEVRIDHGGEDDLIVGVEVDFDGEEGE